MKTKFNLLFLFASMCLGFRTNAQSLIVQAGFSLSEIKDSGSGALILDSKMKPGFHAGIAYELPVHKWLSFMPGLMYSNKGAKMDQNFLGSQLKITGNFHYIDVPLLFKATGKLEGGMKIFGVLGPYVGVGVAGRLKATATDGDGVTESNSEKVTWGNSADDYARRMDFGGTAGAGIEFKSFLVSVNYDLGLANISNSGNQTGMEDSDYASRNRVLRLTVGYRFGKK